MIVFRGSQGLGEDFSRTYLAFLKCSTKRKEEASATPKAEAKAKALKAKKMMVKGVHSHKKDLYVTCLLSAKDTAAPNAA